MDGIIPAGLLLQYEKNALRYARFGGFSLFSGNKNSFTGPQNTVATAGTYNTSRTRHDNLTGKQVSQLAMVFSNYAIAGSTEVANPNALLVQAALENLSPNGVNTQDQPRQPVPSPNGGVSIYTALTVERRAVFVCEPVPHPVASGGTVFTRVGATVGTNGQVFPRGGCQYGGTPGANWSTNNGEGTNGGTNNVADGGGNVSANFTSYYFSESELLAKLADGTIATGVAICGDSISDGTDDAGFGSAVIGGVELRWFANTPHTRLSIPGERLGNIFSSTGPTSSFYCRLQRMAFATHVTSGYGRNDVEQYATFGGTVAGALALFKANLLAFALYCMSQGQQFAQLTILPAPSSTDGWFTAANQSPQSDANKESLRNQINSWLTDTSAAGFVAQANAQVATGFYYPGKAFVLDRCAAIECNTSGVLTPGGGCILGSQSGVATNGTATSATTTTLVDSGKTWTTNAYQGYGVYIVSGTGVGQMRCIAYNNATTLTLDNAFSVTPDNTSVYQVYQACGMNGVHPLTTGYNVMAANATVTAQVTAFLASR